MTDVSSTLLSERPRDGILRLTLNRPEARNALNTELLRTLADALDAAAADASVRVVVLAGGPKAFAAGADIKEIAGHDATSILSDARPEYWKRIREFPKPVVAAVNGLCLGGGNELAMLADIIVAGDNARFGQPEINLGLIPGAGGTQRLTRVVGKSRAMRMVLTGEAIDAATALALGLVAEVTPADETLAKAEEIAAAIAARPPISVRLAKEAVLKAYELPLSDALAHERQSFCRLFDTKDLREGVSAFIEKRSPVFTGR